MLNIPQLFHRIADVFWRNIYRNIIFFIVNIEPRCDFWNLEIVKDQQNFSQFEGAQNKTLGQYGFKKSDYYTSWNALTT